MLFFEQAISPWRCSHCSWCYIDEYQEQSGESVKLALARTGKGHYLNPLSQLELMKNLLALSPEKFFHSRPGSGSVFAWNDHGPGVTEGRHWHRSQYSGYEGIPGDTQLSSYIESQQHKINVNTSPPFYYPDYDWLSFPISAHVGGYHLTRGTRPCASHVVYHPDSRIVVCSGDWMMNLCVWLATTWIWYW